MRQRSYNGILLLVLIICFVSCNNTLIDLPKVARGNAQFSNYIAVGGTETSGFADGALYQAGQQHSYAYYLGEEFGITSGITFNQPLVGNNNGIAFSGGTAVQRLVLGYYNYPPCNSQFAGIVSGIVKQQPNYFAPMLIPIRQPGMGELNGVTAVPLPPYNNLGVPDLHMTDFQNPNLSTQNFFYFRMYGNPPQYPTLLTFIKNNPATFFTVWLGTQEILDYALAPAQNIPIPSMGTFKTELDSVLNALTIDTGAGGVIATVPDITDYPFFNAIAYNGLVLDTGLAAELNALVGGPGIHFQVGNNPFIVADPTVPGGKRQMLPTEKVLLSTPLDTLKCALQGSVVPLNPQYFLNATQVATIQQAVQNYNAVITNEAATRNILVADLYSLYKSLKTGITYSGQTFTNTFVTGYFFSLDGINPSFQGHAIIANTFIKQINASYRSTIPQLDPTTFNGPSYP